MRVQGMDNFKMGCSSCSWAKTNRIAHETYTSLHFIWT